MDPSLDSSTENSTVENPTAGDSSAGDSSTERAGAGVSGAMHRMSARWEQRVGALQWYLVIFGAIVTAPIVAIVVLRMRSRSA